MLLSGGTNGEASPIREGFAALIVAPNGRVRLAAALADNTPSAQTRFLSAGGNIPFYTSLYRGGGSCFGWLTLLETPASDVHGQLRWTNPAGMPGPFHPSGFREKLILIGSRNSATNPPAPGRGAP